MERRRDERLSVGLKAALLDDKTLPRGCRVRDFSQRGMLLQYDYDGNDATFSDGDTVTVRLSLRQDHERKVVTLPSTVRRVEDNGIGVEFHQPEAQLLELLEPYRLDRRRVEEAALEADRTGKVNGSGTSSVTRLLRPRGRHRVLSGRPPAPAPGGSWHADRPTAHAAARTADAGLAREHGAPALSDRRLFYVGLVTLVCAALIVIIDFADNAALKRRLSALETDSRNHAAALSGMGNRLSTVDRPVQELADLNARVETLAVSVAALEGRLAPVARGQSIEVAGMEKAAAAVADASVPEKSIVSPRPEAKTAGSVGEVEAALDKPVAGSDADWVINLVSLYDKAAADRFMSTAKSKGVRVDQNEVTVKGRQVWRLQITGFTTHQEARAYAAGVSEKLGLKDVWVFKR
jgi:hypothetical protein